MASVHEYKRLENKLVQKIRDTFLIAASLIAGIFKGLGKFLTKRYTIVFVPHSEKKVYNLHITVLSVFCFLLVVFGIFGAFFLYGTNYSGSMYTIANKDGRLKETQASLDQFRDEANLLFREARNFQNILSDVIAALGLSDNNTLSQNTAGDLSSIISIRETPEGMLHEVDGMRRLTMYLSQAVEPIREIGILLDSQSALLTEIPSIWPVRGGIGNITMFFGQNINPISGQHYIHKGIDIATYRSGDPVVATADGQVVTAEYTYDFGYYIIIRHKHGYYTRYAHLQSFRVSAGQRVQQNEVIGYIGNTGVSTGPHLHYEVHIGSDVVDPYRYITIRSSMARQGR
ncbi:MAG: M23 family metallopeptidase [Treponema sp.]|jgi:murein DD-endopeptidase MepM/ murein hydrolase activator NlpD|nr:M23 family metallopeptidase [Treponema sp.]